MKGRDHSLSEPESGSNDSAKVPEGNYIASELERVTTQQKAKRIRCPKTRSKSIKKRKIGDGTVDEKLIIEQTSKKHNEKDSKRIKRKIKERRKLKTFTRRLWGDDEDKAITKLVKKYGIKKWTLISRKLQEEYQIYGRSGKQCRER